MIAEAPGSFKPTLAPHDAATSTPAIGPALCPSHFDDRRSSGLGGLWPTHRSFLRSLGLNDDAIARGEFRSVDSAEASSLLDPGCSDPAAIPAGIAITYRDNVGRRFGYTRVVVGPQTTLSPRGTFSAPPYIP